MEALVDTNVIIDALTGSRSGKLNHPVASSVY